MCTVMAQRMQAVLPSRPFALSSCAGWKVYMSRHVTTSQHHVMSPHRFSSHLAAPPQLVSLSYSFIYGGVCGNPDLVLTWPACAEVGLGPLPMTFP